MRGAYVTYSGRNRVVTVGNGFFSRTLSVDPNVPGVATVRFRTRDGRDLIRGSTEEFRIRVGEKDVLGFGGDLVFDSYETSGDPSGVRRVRIALKSKSQPNTKPMLKVSLGFDVFPDVPVMRKSLEMTNTSGVPLRIGGVIAERLAWNAPARVVGWDRSDTLTPWTLPASVSEEGGLFWLQSSSSAYPAVGFANEAPGPLKRAEVAANGDLLVGTGDVASDFWMQTDETVALPAVWMYLAQDGNVLSGSAAFLEALRTAGRTLRHDDAAAIYAGEVADATPANLSRLRPGSVVCLNYAWQKDLNAQSQLPTHLFRAAVTIRNAGLRFGIRVPMAWLPVDWTDKNGVAWAQTDANGKPVAATWDGTPGVQASVASDYGVVASRSLIAIANELGPDYVLLDGSLRIGDRAAVGYGTEPRRRVSDWTLWTRALWMLNTLARERPQTAIGVSSSLYGMSRGFDLPMSVVGFLWSWGSEPTTNNPFWRMVQPLAPKRVNAPATSSQ
jgi:hypothetical protein